jgi:predicted component of type VI protein secretion system
MREVRELIKEKAQLVAQENRLLADREQMVTVEQYLMGMTALGAAVRRLVDDPDTLRAIDAEFRRLADRPERGRA